MRNIRADYKAAYIAEYEAYRRAGRDEDADTVAKILRDHYAHDVETAVPVDDTEKRDGQTVKAPAEPGDQDTEPDGPETPDSGQGEMPDSGQGEMPAEAEKKTAAPRKTAAKRTPAKPADSK